MYCKRGECSNQVYRGWVICLQHLAKSMEKKYGADSFVAVKYRGLLPDHPRDIPAGR